MDRIPNINLSRLADAIQRARLTHRRERVERAEMIRQYVGNHYGNEGTSTPVPCNLLSMYVKTCLRNLIDKNPRAMMSTFRRDLKPVVAAMQQWSTPELERMGFAQTMARWVVNAFFGLSPLKVALASPADAARSGFRLRPGMPYAETIDFDDWAHDPHARDVRDSSFMAHRFRAPLAAIKADKSYSKQRMKLAPTEDIPFNEQGDLRVQAIEQGFYNSGATEFEDHVDLWEIYLPRHKLVLTMPHSQITGPNADSYNEPLKVQRWLGPVTGPYHFINFGIVPGNAMPKAPVQDLYDLHMAINDCLRKLLRQAQRLKQVLPVPGVAANDAQRLIETSDGEAFKCEMGNAALQQVTLGGPDQQIFMLLQWLQQLFSWLAGNLDVIGGLQPQAKTVGQEKILSGAASGGISDMRETVVNGTSDVIRSLGWYWWYHPQQVMTTEYHPPGLDAISLLRQITPIMRQAGRYEDLDIKIDPYSLVHQTPDQRLSALTGMIQGIMIPLMPMLQQQGIMFDLNTYLKQYAHYQDSPDIMDLVKFQEPPTMQGGQADQPQPGTPPPPTPRSYGQENRSSATAAGNQRMMQQAVMGQDQSNPNTNHALAAA